MGTFFTNAKYTRRLLVVPAAHPRQKDTTSRPEDELKIALQEYRVPNAALDALTLIFTHGTSFNKDLWDVIIDKILLCGQLAHKVKRVIAMDAVTHGDSAVLNAGKLGEKTFWPDHSYDILTVLQMLGVSKPLVGIGHSFGGGILAHAALISPDTFTATMFIDPILFVMPKEDMEAAQIALRRRDHWPSITDAHRAFQKSRGLSDWNPRQREIYAEKGTVEDAGAGTRSGRVLKTPKLQEAATYIAAPFPGLLDLLRDSKGRHVFVLGESSRVINAAQKGRIVEAKNSKSTVLEMAGAGHLIPMTHPFELAQLLGEQLALVASSPEGHGAKL